ncbi:effector-associated constant component EACC1 [Saccharopolyspora shandongensis]|uniref:effector-associated constant component EACC1 n=1 Tax=Saccharopolyspora shandongensis TaxID=418495 RepID=UPI00340FA6D9
MVEARINIEEPAASAQRLHDLHDQLMRDLRSVNGIAVRRAREEAPQDSKSGIGAQIAELIVTGTLSGGTLAAVTRVITALINRSANRSVTVKADGREIVLTGTSAKVQRQMLELFAEDEEAQRPADR